MQKSRLFVTNSQICSCLLSHNLFSTGFHPFFSFIRLVQESRVSALLRNGQKINLSSSISIFGVIDVVPTIIDLSYSYLFKTLWVSTFKLSNRQNKWELSFFVNLGISENFSFLPRISQIVICHLQQHKLAEYYDLCYSGMRVLLSTKNSLNFK